LVGYDDAFISCRSGFMMIFDGKATNNLVLYPPAKPSVDHESPLWDEFEPEEGGIQPILTVGKALCFKNETEDDTINNFISNPPSVTQPTFHLLDSIMNKPNQEILVDDFSSVDTYNP
jgi:hypothetical protein